VSADRLAHTASEAVSVAAEVGQPVALKVCSPDILHKSDAGGVKLGLAGRKQVADAFKAIMDNAARHREDADIRGCVVSPMADTGVEVIVGTKIDPQFGPVIMFGIGGILVEVVKDVSFRVLPISRMAPYKMMREIKSFPILDGVRGRQPVDQEAIAQLLLKISEIIEAYPQIQEMDLNPVIVHESGLTIVDVRIILKKKWKKGQNNKRKSPV